MSFPSHRNTNPNTRQRGSNPVFRPPVSYARPTPQQYGHTTAAQSFHQMHYPTYTQFLAPAQAPMHDYYQQMYDQPVWNGYTACQYTYYEQRQWAYGSYGPYFQHEHALINSGQVQSFPATALQGYGQLNGYQGLPQNVQALTGHSPMLPVSVFQYQTDWPCAIQAAPQQIQAQYNYALYLSGGRKIEGNEYQLLNIGTAEPQQHVQQFVEAPSMQAPFRSKTQVSKYQNHDAQHAPGPPKLPLLNRVSNVTNTTDCIEKGLVVYHSPSDASDRPPGLSSPDDTTTVPVEQPKPLPKRPPSPLSSTSSTADKTSNSVDSSTTYVTVAVEPRSTSQPARSSPTSDISKDISTNNTNPGNTQVQSGINSTEQAATAIMLCQSISAELLGEEVSATPQPRAEKAPLAGSPNIKNPSLVKLAGTPNAQINERQQAKEIVNPGRHSTSPVDTNSTPKPALCNPPEIEVATDNHISRPETDTGSSLQEIQDIVMSNQSTELKASPKTGTTQLISVPGQKPARTDDSITNKSPPTKGKTQPIVIFLRPGKIAVEARKLNRVLQPENAVEKSDPRNQIVEQSGSQRSRQRGSLGLEYLNSPSPKQYRHQKAQSFQPFPSEDSLSACQKAPSVVSQFSSFPSTSGVSSIVPASSNSAQNMNPSLDEELSPSSPRHIRRHSLPKIPRNTPERDTDPANVLTDTADIEYQSDNPDLQDCPTAPAKPQTRSGKSDDLKLQVAISPQIKANYAEVLQISKQGSISHSSFAAEIAKFTPKIKPRTLHPRSSPEEGEIIESEESFPPYGYPHTNKLKGPHPSLARTPVQPIRGSCWYDEPVLRKRKRRSSDDSLWSPPTFSSPMVKDTEAICYCTPGVPSSPLLPKMKSHRKRKFSPTVSSDFHSDVDMEDIMVVDCPPLLRMGISSKKLEGENSASRPQKRLLARASNVSHSPITSQASGRS
ncbi:hypothetical protein ONS95_012631 [Cadophora gregata]|uniref:uncharacterized protein n=1 Tax=Cadophora gregata TaxID=51156 RepID=UPI0026DC672F|nr:uncharacterized protein ONS95_012631 [Cadophora gregata]KAK0118341.1 hypothetical protein ONS95_012631 [Cadophora gregata]KAK0123411.1 hypothetical protein ONS96_010397 [Cadophora gregata f. sp. sojae]